MARLLNILLCFTLIIGPVWVGSYFGEWRWPVIYSAITTGILALVFARPQKAPLSFWILLLTLLTLSAQGLWMWYNTHSLFIENNIFKSVHYMWHLEPLTTQPHPELPGAPDKAEAWDRLSYILPCLLIVLATRQLVASRVLQLGTLCGTIFWTGVFIAALGLLQRFTGAEGIYWSDELIFKYRQFFFATYRSPGIATSYLNIAFAAGLAHLLSITHKLIRRSDAKPTHPLLICIGLIVLFSGSMTTGSKAGTVFTAGTLLLWTAMNFKGMIHMIRNADALFPSGSPHERNIILGAVTIASIFAVLNFGETVTKRWKISIDKDHQTLQLRHIANSVQIDMTQKPDWGWAGYGPGSFYPLFPLHVDKKTDKALHHKWVYAHNDHLQTLVEWGWFGTGCFILLIGGGGTILLVENFSHHKKHRTHHLFYFRGMGIAMFICLLHATVDFPFQIESIAITFSAILGAAWAATSLRLKFKMENEECLGYNSQSGSRSAA